MKLFQHVFDSPIRKAGMTLAVMAILGPVVWSTARHDPRTTAKILSTGLEIAEHGAITIQYKAHHFNGPNFEAAKTRAPFMDFLNAEVWGKMGSAKLDFDIQFEEETLEAGEYVFGINMSKDEEFYLAFWKGDEKLTFPLVVEKSSAEVPYLNITIMATKSPDTYVIETRCGPFRGTTDLVIPHDDGDDDH